MSFSFFSAWHNCMILNICNYPLFFTASTKVLAGLKEGML
jgi:hypothetical protein